MPDVPDELIFACSALVRHVPQVAEALELEDGPVGVVFAGVTIYLVVPPSRMRRHERQHQIQAARFAPRWARWLPVWVRAWLGAVRFSEEYARLHQAHGIEAHPLELEARQAEQG